MTDNRGGSEGKAARAERLAAELRANLRRRKEQARARNSEDAGRAVEGTAPEARDTPAEAPRTKIE